MIIGAGNRNVGRACRGRWALLVVAACCAGVLFGGTTTVTFYGGAGQVGGSSAVVQNGETRVLVDCGTSYGDEETRNVGSEGRDFGFDPAALSAVVLTHAHQDHAGRVPQLVRAGFKGEIWMTPASLAILRIVWRSQISYETDVRREWVWTTRDGGGKKFHWRKECEWAGKVSEKNRRTFTGTHAELEAHMKKERGEKTYISPCRTCQEHELEEVVRHVRTVGFGESLALAPFKVVLRPVKHLPGAAAVYFDDGEATFAFSGDLGTKRSRFVARIDPAEPVDAVFVETTYGDASHGGADATEAEYRRFRETVGRVVGAGGIAWIPAFALDRSQRVLAEVARGIDEGLISGDVPIYYLSPSSRAMTEEYLNHPEWFDNALPGTIAPLFKRSAKRFNAKKHKGAAILLTTSGMMDMGFSYSLIPELVPRADVTVCLVGYQSPAACGGQLKRGDKTLRVTAAGKPTEVSVRCGVEDFWCFSGHGDAQENDAWLANNLKAKIYLVHGDVEHLGKRKEGLEKRFGADVQVVRTGVSYPMAHRPAAVSVEKNISRGEERAE